MAGLTKEWLKLNIETLELDYSNLKPSAKNELAAYKIALAAMEASTEPAAPGEWITVPKNPTWEMLSEDGCKEHHNGQECLHHDNRRRIWQAMLKVAPQLPQSALDLREVFEAWAISKCWDVRRGETGAYISMCTHDGWTVVSACRDAIIAAKGDCR
ncbi:hypothetical protein N8V28_21380 [Enterobacter hormaechei subsp. hoffmannii]|nr:hypothetical protein [Enterobacter hormaechei subsp. hoffmannii]